MTERLRRPAALRRDRLTFTLYGAFVVWGWFLYAFSPTVSLLTDELGVSRGQAGLHGTALAGGSVIGGLLTPWLATRFGRRIHFLVGSTLFATGIGLLMVGRVLPATLAAVLILAVGGNLTITASQPALVVHHGRAGSAAVTEANGTGSGVGLLAPLAVGVAVALGWGWRPAVGFAAVLAVIAAVGVATLRGEPAMERPTPADPAVPRVRTPSARWSRAFWFFLVAMICGAAVEFSTIFWAPDLLTSRTGMAQSSATSAVAALVLGMTLARFVVGPLSVRKAPEKLLLVGWAVAGVGWAIFWLTTSPLVAVAGLLVAGFGYGTHYPLSVALVLRASDGRPDQAQGTASLAVGFAVGVAPFALGAVADVVGPHVAFLLVGGFIAVGGVAVALGLREVHRALRRAAAEAAADAPPTA